MQESEQDKHLSVARRPTGIHTGPGSSLPQAQSESSAFTMKSMSPSCQNSMPPMRAKSQIIRAMHTSVCSVLDWSDKDKSSKALNSLNELLIWNCRVGLSSADP